MGMLQLSVLRVFQAILSDKAFRKQEGSGEVINLATHVTRNLCARLVPDNPYPEGTCSLCEDLPAWAAARLVCCHSPPNPQREKLAVRHVEGGLTDYSWQQEMEI